MEVKPGYKQTEAGVIPQEWDCSKLGNFISLQRGHDLTWRDRREGDVPVMGSAGQNGYHHTAIAKGPGVVLGRSGASFGQAHYCDQDFWPHNTALYVTDFRGNDPRFVFYFLKSIDFSRHNSGGAQQSLTRNFIYPILVGVPTLPEQRVIAEALSNVDTLLRGLDRLITKKRDLKQAAMQQLLTGQTRLPGFHGKWEVKRLGDVCRITTGKKDVNEGNPNGQFPFFTCSRSHTYSDSYSFDTEAILIAGNGEVGNLNYYKGKFEAYQRTYVLSAFSVPVKYLWQQLNAYLAETLGLGKVGSSIPYIKKENLVSFEYKSPQDNDEQTAVAAVLSDMDAEVAVLEARRDKTRNLKLAMMRELLTGKTRLVPAGTAHA